jgi:DegV family protein with EDD domain
VHRIGIVTDSSSNLPEEKVARYGINVVPIYLHWNGRTYLDGIDIEPQDVYRRLRENKQIPHTAAPSVGDFLQTYLRLSREVDGIVSIHPPASLSGVVKTARTAAKLVEEIIPVHVIDAGTAAMGAGFVTLAAARTAENGGDLTAVHQAALTIRDRVTVYAMLDTLEYLYHGGRIGKAAALLGVALRMKPILILNQNDVDVLAKPRTCSRAIQAMLDEMARRVDGRPVHVAVLHADALETANALREKIVQNFDCVEVMTCAFTPVMGAHTGPGLLGVAFYDDLCSENVMRSEGK